MTLGQAVVEFEVKIEENILKPLQHLVDIEIPNIHKLRRNVNKHTDVTNAAKAKLTQANNRHSMNVAQGNKVDSVRDEYEEALTKMEQSIDVFATEVFALVAREPEISKWVVDFLNYQKEYHASVYAKVSELVSGVENRLAASAVKPVYGMELEEHLKSSHRTIAYPIELCVCGLLETALEEEGLFR